MLRDILENTGIEAETVSSLLGVDPELFQKWITNQRPIPSSVLGVLSSVVGTDLAPILNRKVPPQEAAATTPAIWYRFRADRLVSQDREFVFLIRRLGYFMHELEEITGAKSVGWKALFQEIRQTVDIQAPPRVQGIQAANMFRESRGLAVGAVGIGEVIRSNLRSMGVMVVETPVPRSSLEGCCFYVGSRPNERPCVFANTHHTTWFRRNVVLMHEVAHAIFEAELSGAALDFVDQDRNVLAEERADAFAQQVMVPRQVLVHISQKHGIRWDSLSAASLARLVAETHTEQRMVLRAAYESELISADLYQEYAAFDISSCLPALTTHALSTDEYIRVSKADAHSWLGKRNTTVGPQSLRLPVPYIKAVLESYGRAEVSCGKAADMLMIDVRTFEQRFGGLAPEETDEAGDNLAFAY